MTSEIQLDRLRYVAGHYRDLQGLALVPFGLVFLAPGFIPNGWGQQGETWRWLMIAGAPLLFGLLYGLPWIIGGLGDHIFLIRSLKPLPKEAVDGGI